MAFQRTSMNSRPSPFQKLVSFVPLAAYLMLALTFFVESVNRQIVAQLTATADPLVPRAEGQRSMVQLFTNYRFVHFFGCSSEFPFRPSSGCQGRWERVLFEINFSENAAVQFDTASVYLAKTDNYSGTTPEPLGNHPLAVRPAPQAQHA